MIFELENAKPFPKSDESQGLLDLVEETFSLIMAFYGLFTMSNATIAILSSITGGSAGAMLFGGLQLAKIANEAYAICKDLLKSLKAWRKRSAETTEKDEMLDIVISEITVQLDGYSETYIWVDKGEPSSSGGGGGDGAEDAPGDPHPSS